MGTGRCAKAAGLSAAALVVVFLWMLPAWGGSRLISHFENDHNGDPWGRDVLRDFYNSRGAGADDNLYPNTAGTMNLAPFPLVSTPFSDLGALPRDPFEIHQFAADGSAPAFAGMVGENRFAAFGSGWSLGAQDQVEDFQINFINVSDESDDVDYTPENPDSGKFLANNEVTGVVQRWSDYEDLCFYLCVNIGGYLLPSTQGFWSKVKIQLWEYDVDVQGGPPWTVARNEREVWEVTLATYEPSVILPHAMGFTGWRHLRIPFSAFHKVPWDDTYWRYGHFVSEEAYNAMNGRLDTDAIRAIVFRKERFQDRDGTFSQPADRVIVAVDEIVVTGATNASVLRVNVPGNVVGRCREIAENRGLSWAPLFADDPDQARPYTGPVSPSSHGVMRCTDVRVKVRDWQQLSTTFSAEVGNGAVVSKDSMAFSSEMVFVPQFQAPGTWVQRWSSGGDFSRRKGTMELPPTGFLGRRYLLFYTGWRYDYARGAPSEHYLVSYDPGGVTPLARLDPSADPRGGFLANYFREFGYAYGTLFVLPRDASGNIGRAQAIDVLFEQQTGSLRYERLTR